MLTVLVDITAPVQGWVVDGRDAANDITYSSNSASVSATYNGFYDPESHIKDTAMSVFRRHTG